MQLSIDSSRTKIYKRQVKLDLVKMRIYFKIRVEPMRVTTNARISRGFDYQPDVCKVTKRLAITNAKIRVSFYTTEVISTEECL